MLLAACWAVSYVLFSDGSQSWFKGSIVGILAVAFIARFLAC